MYSIPVGKISTTWYQNLVPGTRVFIMSSITMNQDSVPGTTGILVLWYRELIFIYTFVCVVILYQHTAMLIQYNV